MSHSSLPKPEFRQEIRLGLVVYGGVSLAIYINGICREFYNALRGRGIYKLLKALTDSDIVVDIISGTSAGGINGVLLSYALTHSTKDEIVDFAEFGDLWREHGSIGSLMHKPNPAQPTDFESVLDGDNYYQDKLEEAFKIPKKPSQEQKEDWVSGFNELDLFVTGTDVLGRIYQVFDSTGSAIEVKDHRTVFLLKHRAGRKEPFQPSHKAALAKLCRITSCFPVAFPVVTVKLPDRKGASASSIDTQLITWGQLDKRPLPAPPPKDGYQLHFVDGGVLDNRPFSYTIKEMYYRTAYRPVERKLFYIDPSPDRFFDSPSWQQMQKPNVGKVAIDCLVGMPRYESIGNDLEQIREHNERVRRYKYQLAAVDDWEPEKLERAVAGGTEEEIYLRSRMVSLRDRVLPLIFRTQTNLTDENLVQDKQKILEKVAALLTKYVTDSQEQDSRRVVFQTFAQQIRNLDVDYALRKHFFIIQNICGLVTNKEISTEDEKRLAILSGKLGRQIKLLEVIRAALDQLLESEAVSNYFYSLVNKEPSENQLRDDIYDLLLRLHRFLLDTKHPEILGEGTYVPDFREAALNQEKAIIPGEIDLETQIKAWFPQQDIDKFYQVLKQRITQIQASEIEALRSYSRYELENGRRENDSNVYRSMLRSIELASEILIYESGFTNSEQILEKFNKYRQIDRILYPSEYLSGVSEKELVELVRISPRDAKLGYSKGKSPESKLSGDVLGAFGGFFKKSWRSNDILWGRLDGLNRLVETLLTPESARHFVDFLTREAGVEAEKRAGYIENLIKEAFGESNESQAIAQIWELLLSLDRELLATGKCEAHRVADLVSSLVEAGHRQIIETDIDEVVKGAIADQLDWNLQSVAPPTDKSSNSAPSIPTYDPVKGYFDRLLTPSAIADLAKQSFAGRDKEAFFNQDYKVGSETISNNIPSIVLVNLASRASLILRDMGLKLYLDRKAKSGRSRLANSPFDGSLQVLYRFLNTSLQLFNWWVQSQSPVLLKTQKFSRSLVIKLLIQFLALTIMVIALIIAIPKLYTLAATKIPFYAWAIAAGVAALVYCLLDISGRRRK